MQIETEFRITILSHMWAGRVLNSAQALKVEIVTSLIGGRSILILPNSKQISCKSFQGNQRNWYVVLRIGSKNQNYCQVL